MKNTKTKNHKTKKTKNHKNKKTKQNKTKKLKNIKHKQKGSGNESPNTHKTLSSIINIIKPTTLLPNSQIISYKYNPNPIPNPNSNKYYFLKNNKEIDFNILLNNIITNKKDKKDETIIQFESFIETYLKENLTRNDRYDITILCALMNIMYDYKKPVIYNYINEKNKESKTINANRLDITCCYKVDGKLPFFIEDIYCEDLNLFITEYDKFIADPNHKSEFFYKSNVANMALLFKCYYNRCFDKYIAIKSNEFKYSNEDKNSNNLNLYNQFNKIKMKLLNHLVKSYISCSYTDICDLYIEYLKFYIQTLGQIFTTYIFDILSLNNYYEHNKNAISTKFNQMNTDIINIINTSKINKDLFIYLSCFHTSEYKQARFYMTRFIDSYIGLDGVHGDIMNTMDVIAHDFYFHGNLERNKKTSPEYDNINKYFIMKLYYDAINFKKYGMYKYGMYILQIIQNEIEKNNPIVFNNNFYNDFKSAFFSNSYKITLDIRLQLSLVKSDNEKTDREDFINWLNFNFNPNSNSKITFIYKDKDKDKLQDYHYLQDFY